MAHLSTEQVLALAPDAAAASAARKLSSASSWVSLGRSAEAAWGECKGSAKEPYRTQVDLNEIAFRCSCPSRKLPCKHGLGLLLLLAAQPAKLAEGAAPPWVAEWLAARATRRSKVAERTEIAADSAPAATKPASRARSADARASRVAAGLAELDRWLHDQLRGGLAGMQAGAPAACAALAARMVDAQAPGVARLLREAGSLAVSGSGWQARLLGQLARLHLLVQAYARLSELPANTQADVRTAIGFTQSQEELLASPSLRDRWLVLGRRVEEEEQLRVQRTWLWGLSEARPALILDFSAGGQPLDRNLVPGSSLDADLVFYPGTTPLRALVRERYGPPGLPAPLPAAPLLEASATYSAALARNPWLEQLPLLIGPCTLAQHDERWQIRDGAGRQLPLTHSFGEGWQLLALSGGQPFSLAGEWDGTALAPLGAQFGEGDRYWVVGDR